MNDLPITLSLRDVLVTVGVLVVVVAILVASWTLLISAVVFAARCLGLI